MATWTLYTTPKGEPIQKDISFRTKTDMMNYAKKVGLEIVKEGPYKYTYRLKRPRSMVPKGVPKDRPIGSPIEKSRARNRAGKRNAQVAKIKKTTKLKQGLKKAGRR